MIRKNLDSLTDGKKSVIALCFAVSSLVLVTLFLPELMVSELVSISGAAVLASLVLSAAAAFLEIRQARRHFRKL